MNLNEIAKGIALREGGKVNLSIAQIKEVLSRLGEVLYWETERGDEFKFVARIVELARKRAER